MHCASVAVCPQATRTRSLTPALSAVNPDPPSTAKMANPVEQAVDELVAAAAVEASIAGTAGNAAGAAGFPPKPHPAAPPKVSGVPPKAQPHAQQASWGSAEDQWMGWHAEYIASWAQAVPKIPPMPKTWMTPERQWPALGPAANGGVAGAIPKATQPCAAGVPPVQAAGHQRPDPAPAPFGIQELLNLLSEHAAMRQPDGERIAAALWLTKLQNTHEWIHFGTNIRKFPVTPQEFITVLKRLIGDGRIWTAWLLAEKALSGEVDPVAFIIPPFMRQHATESAGKILLLGD